MGAMGELLVSVHYGLKVGAEGGCEGTDRDWGLEIGFGGVGG